MLHHCEVSDSFVHPNMKLSNGKNGNGESRLFISYSQEISKIIEEKQQIKIQFHHDYISILEQFVSQDTYFRKNVCKRLEYWKQNIEEISEQTIKIELQNGEKDVHRNYIGQDPHRNKKNKTKEEKENITKWDTLRKSLVPTKTTLKFIIVNSELILHIIYNEGYHKYNKPSGCSFVQIEFLKIFSSANNIEIQHAMNSGEHKERKHNGYFWPVDGYHNCEKHKCCGSSNKPCFWHKYVFEFQGDYWHKEKKDKDLAKKKFYIEKGYKWFEIKEQEFINWKKLIKSIPQNS
tara:strand:+ start:242 stop:1114 length:873 start_codon:yes stop_codon:yes gene_type:complete